MTTSEQIATEHTAATEEQLAARALAGELDED